MNRTNLIIFVLVLLLGVLGLAIYLQKRPVQEQTIQDIQPVLPPKPIKKPIVHYPVPEPVAVQPAPTTETNSTAQTEDLPLPETLPPVQESDRSIQKSLKSLLKGSSSYQLLFIDNFIQKFVTTVDNLPEKRLSRAHLPIKPPGGKFLVTGTSEKPQISVRNYKRYNTYLNLFESLDPDLTIRTYSYFYPLFQTAYEQLGYQNAYFNDRLVYVVEHLMETPNPPDPIQLSHTKVLYTYADPALENLSAGQKILLRLGQDQRSRILKVLTVYHKKLTNLHP